MSGFGRGGFGGGRNSGGGRSSSGRGRGRGGGRGRGRGSGGRSNPSGGGKFPSPILKACANFTTTGTCNNPNCGFAHVVKLHGVIKASSSSQNSQQNSNFNRYNSHHSNNNKVDSVTAVAVWETQGVVKIFTGSKDGFWRLWNFAGTNFVKEFEHNMGGPVECLVVASNFLFCGFEGMSPALPDVTVGMVHAWNLANPADPPIEFQMGPLLPYAHGQAVTKLLVDGQKVLSGSRDGSIKLWSYDQALNGGKGGFGLTQTVQGHAREITGLAVVDSVLWSSSTDGAIRIWDMAKQGECQYAITMSHAGATPMNPQQQQQQSQLPGHTNAITELVSYQTAAGKFILSSSLDGDIKAWNGTTGHCVASESHGEGVVSMTMAADPNNNPFLLVGLESGNLMARNLEPTSKIPNPFSCILTLSVRYNSGHEGAVRTVCQGPSGTFYSGGADGNVMVFQITGDLGL